MTIHDMVGQLPSRLRIRFQSLSKYVRALIREQEEGLRRSNRLSNEDVQLIQLAVFIGSLHFFLREGSKAARGAVNGFESFGVPGFMVGTTEFVGENENVTQGERLAEELMAIAKQNDLLTDEMIDMTPTQLTLHLFYEFGNG